MTQHVSTQLESSSCVSELSEVATYIPSLLGGGGTGKGGKGSEWENEEWEWGGGDTWSGIRRGGNRDTGSGMDEIEAQGVG